MANLDDTVLSTVSDFVKNGEMFTALDVSNKVKDVLPFARHREVRDLVRALFVTEIEPNGYAHTPITVTLADGSTADALLYHSLADSWDLDAKYDAQKRAVTAKRPTNTVAVPVVASTPVSAPVATVVPVVVSKPAVMSSKDLWSRLFSTQPSLFPQK